MESRVQIAALFQHLNGILEYYMHTFEYIFSPFICIIYKNIFILLYIQPIGSVKAYVLCD